MNFEVDITKAKFSKSGKRYDLSIRRESHAWCSGDLSLTQLIAIRDRINRHIDELAMKEEDNDH